MGVKTIIERPHSFAGKLDVRGLVDTHGDQISFVQGNVGRHQHRVAYQPVIDVVGLHAHFFFKGGQVGQLSQRRDHRKQSVQFGHLRHMRLNENNRFFGVDASGQPIEGHIKGILFQIFGGFEGSQGMNIDNTVVTIVFIL